MNPKLLQHVSEPSNQFHSWEHSTCNRKIPLLQAIESQSYSFVSRALVLNLVSKLVSRYFFTKGNKKAQLLRSFLQFKGITTDTEVSRTSFLACLIGYV